MSHFSEVRVEITDEGCLLAALSRLARIIHEPPEEGQQIGFRK
jgi:hypothetical protein